MIRQLFLIALIVPLSLANGQGKPSILFILCDDLGWADVGYNGATYHETPNIDRLAKQAMVFDRSYTRPTCSPSRACLFTGLNAAHTHIYHVEEYFRVPPGQWKIKPPKSEHFYEKPITMLGDAMKSAGYATGYVGKWHVDNDPAKHGFDFNAGGWQKGAPASYFSPYKNPKLKDGPKGEYLPERLADECIGFIQRNKTKPFFLCYAPYSVHYPTQARKEDIKRFEERKKEDARQLPVYAAMVYALDRAVGRVVAALGEENLLESTLIVFTSDNGANGRHALSGPLRGSKGSVYEGGVRVPTFVIWPGRIQPIHTPALIDVIDWYPTLIEVAGAAPPGHGLDGKSLVPLLRGKVGKVRDALYLHVPVYNGSEGRRDVLNPFFQSPATVEISGRYKYIRNYEPDRVDELYDLDTDVGETHNMAKANPEVTGGMSRRLDQWVLENKAELPAPLEKQCSPPETDRGAVF